MLWGSLEYLVPDERAEITVRRHSACLVAPVARTVLVVAVLLWLQLQLPASAGAVQSVLWLGSLVALGWLARDVLGWWGERLVVTTYRLLLTQGIITRTVTMMPLGKVTDLTFVHTPAGRLLGYATMKVESAGQDQALSRLRYMPWGADLRARLTALVFAGRAADDHE